MLARLPFCVTNATCTRYLLALERLQDLKNLSGQELWERKELSVIATYIRALALAREQEKGGED